MPSFRRFCVLLLPNRFVHAEEGTLSNNAQLATIGERKLGEKEARFLPASPIQSKWLRSMEKGKTGPTRKTKCSFVCSKPKKPGDKQKQPLNFHTKQGVFLMEECKRGPSYPFDDAGQWWG